MPLELTAEEIDIGTPTPSVILHTQDAEELGAHPLDRLQIRHNGRTHVGIVEVTDELVPPGRMAVTRQLGHVDGVVTVSLAPQPESVAHIHRKLEDVELEREELEAIVRDIHDERLNDVELGAYVSGLYANGLSLAETMHLTEAMTDVGHVMEWDVPVVGDKHSIGGVAGNRVTPVVVPIVAAAGVTIPKTSSRAITSPAGTADMMEVLCDVSFSIEEIRRIVAETGGCIIWGGSVNLSPVDDRIVRAERPLSLDPPGQVIASVLSKKKSVGATHLVVDIPYGDGAKVGNLTDARELAEDFKRVADSLGIQAACTLTRGEKPIGEGIGPVLEARDVLRVLDGDGPEDLERKSVRLADILLELCGADGDAREILESGTALGKFREILAAQGGDPDVSADDLQPGRERSVVRADRSGVVTHVSSRAVSQIARRAGAPKAKRAGMELHCEVGETVAAGEELFTIYAEVPDKLAEASAFEETVEAVRVADPDEALVEQV